MSESKKRQLRKVLQEEDYISTLSSIVQRDYFPDLPELQKKAAVMGRRAVRDFAGAVAVRRAARSIEGHEVELARAEEDDELNVDANGVRHVPRPLHRETLTGFHARVTSEDNHEFEQTQQREVKARREILNEVFGQNGPAISDGREIGNRTPLMASDQFMPTYHRLNAPKNTSAGNSFFFTPDHASNYQNNSPKHSKLMILDAPTKEERKDCELMPPPEQRQTTEKSSFLMPRRDMVEFIPKESVEKHIQPSQTRFSTEIVVSQQNLLGNGDDGSSTTDYSTDALTDLDSVPVPLYMERNARTKRQDREQQMLVAMTPMIIPGRAGAPDSPITTWGTINSTPIVLGGMEYVINDMPMFSVPNENAKERAARIAEANLVKKSRTTKAKRESRSMTPVVNHTTSLTPAARLFLAKTHCTGSSSFRAGSALGSALRSSYTPRVSSQQPSSRQSDHNITPRITSRNTNAILPSSHSNEEPKRGQNLTDGLLNI